MTDVTPEMLARAFHEVYERLAPSFGYETRPDSAVTWEKVPEVNKRLMIAVCQELLGTVLNTRSHLSAQPKRSKHKR